MIKAVLGVAFALGIAGPAAAQTLNMMKSIDAPHYDAQRTTWGPTSDIVNMFQDTLVPLMYEVTNKKLKGMRPHMIYQNTFYKGLDASF
jgi:hypothetical protein